MKNKKGTWLLSWGIVMITTVVLSMALVNFYYKFNSKNQQGITEYIGQTQAALINSYQEAEKIKTYLDLSAKYSFEQAYYQLSESGGLAPTASGQISEDEQNYPCGSFIYPQWNNENKECFPDYKTGFLDYYDKELSSYLVNYPYKEIPAYNYDYELKELTNRQLQLVGVAKTPIKLDIATGEVNEQESFKSYSGGSLINPLKGYNKIESCFGYRGNLGYSRDHAGIDLPATRGTPVMAAASGKVYSIDSSRWGRLVIDHGTFMTEYLHLDSITAANGAQVNQGDIIGYVGQRGPKGRYQYGSHLHFGVIDNNAPSKLLGPDNYDLILQSFGIKKYVNPLCFFDANTKFELSDSLACHSSVEGYCKITDGAKQCSKGEGPYKGCNQYSLVQNLNILTTPAQDAGTEFSKRGCFAKVDLSNINAEVKDNRMTMEELQKLIDSRSSEEYIKAAHRDYQNVPEELIKAFMRVESKAELYNPDYQCTRSICGVMQTTKDICENAKSQCNWNLARTGNGLRDSIFAGTRHLSELLKGKESCIYVEENNPDYFKVALCYNAGHAVANRIISNAAERVYGADSDIKKDKDKKKKITWSQVNLGDVRRALMDSGYYYSWGGEKKVTEIFEYPNLIMLGLGQYCGEDYTYQPALLGTYSFMPHFTITGANYFADYDALVGFSKAAIAKCGKENSVKQCLLGEIERFNNDNNGLSLSIGCEKEAEKPFYDFIEQLEYCKISKDSDCICRLPPIDKLSFKDEMIGYETKEISEADYSFSQLELGKEQQIINYPDFYFEKNNNMIKITKSSSLKDCSLPSDYVGVCAAGKLDCALSKQILEFVDAYEQCASADANNCRCHVVLKNILGADYELRVEKSKIIFEGLITSSYQYPYPLMIAKSVDKEPSVIDSLDYKPQLMLYKKTATDYVFVEEVKDKKSCKMVEDKFRVCARYKNKMDMPEIRFALQIRETIPPALLWFEAVKTSDIYSSKVILSWKDAQESDFDHYKIFHSKLGFSTKGTSYYTDVKTIELGQPDGACNVLDLPVEKFVHCIDGNNYYVLQNPESNYFAVVAVDEFGNEADVTAKMAVENAGIY